MKNARTLLISNGICVFSSAILFLFVVHFCDDTLFQGILGGMLGSAIIAFFPSLFVYFSSCQESLDSLVSRYQELIKLLESHFSETNPQTIDKATVMREIALLKIYAAEATRFSKRFNEKLIKFVKALQKFDPMSDINQFKAAKKDADNIINNISLKQDKIEEDVSDFSDTQEP